MAASIAASPVRSRAPNPARRPGVGARAVLDRGGELGGEFSPSYSQPPLTFTDHPITAMLSRNLLPGQWDCRANGVSASLSEP